MVEKLEKLAGRLLVYHLSLILATMHAHKSLIMQAMLKKTCIYVNDEQDETRTTA